MTLRLSCIVLVAMFLSRDTLGQHNPWHPDGKLPNSHLPDMEFVRDAQSRIDSSLKHRDISRNKAIRWTMKAYGLELAQPRRRSVREATAGNLIHWVVVATKPQTRHR